MALRPGPIRKQASSQSTGLADGAVSAGSPIERGVSALRACLGEDGALWLEPIAGNAVGGVSYALRLPEDHLGIARKLRLDFPPDFPREGLRLQVDPSPWLVWPHAMPRQLCLFGFQQQPVSGTPEEIVQATVQRLRRLLGWVLAGSDPVARQREFDNEILSYWQEQVPSSLQQVVLLQRPTDLQPLYALSDMRAQRSPALGTVWLAEDPRLLARHWERLTGARQQVRAPAMPGLFVPLQSLPPVEAPKPAAVFDWIEPHVAPTSRSALRTWAAETGGLDRRWVLLQLPGTPPAMHAWVLDRGGLRREHVHVYGRRAGRRSAPRPAQAAIRVLQTASVHVLDRETLHSRDPALAGSGLEGAHIVMVGIGSLGSQVAAQLARAGVGRLTLIDPELLEDANVGRHVLGADELGRFKAQALCERLRCELPTLHVVPRAEYVQVALRKYPTDFDTADLVVVTTADWPSELALWEAKLSGAPWGLLQAWSEPHAQVGHALFAPPGASDARHLFEATGHFRHSYSSWPDGGTQPLPACGASYIPGGPVALGAIASMVAHAAVRTLTEDAASARWYTSINDPQGIIRAGGSYQGPPLPERGAQLSLTRDWPSASESAS